MSDQFVWFLSYIMKEFYIICSVQTDITVGADPGGLAPPLCPQWRLFYIGPNLDSLLPPPPFFNSGDFRQRELIGCSFIPSSRGLHLVDRQNINPLILIYRLKLYHSVVDTQNR